MAAKLACGGKGPCCHIGYAHRHCEHCDVVVSLHTCQPYPWSNARIGQPWLNGSLQGAGVQGAGVNQFLNALAAVDVYANNTATTMNSVDIETHTCEVK